MRGSELIFLARLAVAGLLARRPGNPAFPAKAAQQVFDPSMPCLSTEKSLAAASGGMWRHGAAQRRVNGAITWQVIDASPARPQNGPSPFDKEIRP